MVVLLTNDDGIRADGLAAVRRELERQGDVRLYVVAPDRERSASGHSITLLHPLHVEEVDLGGAARRAWSVSGTPVDCVKLAIHALLDERPQVVISGVNRGANLGTDVFYSGTVSGALEALLLGVPSLAVSLASLESGEYGVAARVAVALARLVVERGLPPRTLLNVNVPSLEPADIAGVRVTRLGVHKYHDVFEQRTDPRGRVYFWLKGESTDLDDDPYSDGGALRDNMISITPVQIDLTDYRLLEELKTWPLDPGGLGLEAAAPGQAATSD